MDKCIWINGVHVLCKKAKAKFSMNDKGKMIYKDTKSPVDYPECPYCRGKWEQPPELTEGQLCKIKNVDRWEVVRTLNYENGKVTTTGGGTYEMTALEPGIPTGFDSNGIPV